MRLQETIAHLNAVKTACALTGYVIDSYEFENVENVGIVSSVAVTFPFGRSTPDLETVIAANLPVYKFKSYQENPTDIFPTPALNGGVTFRFTWTDSSGGI